MSTEVNSSRGLYSVCTCYLVTCVYMLGGVVDGVMTCVDLLVYNDKIVFVMLSGKAVTYTIYGAVYH